MSITSGMDFLRAAVGNGLPSPIYTGGLDHARLADMGTRLPELPFGTLDHFYAKQNEDGDLLGGVEQWTDCLIDQSRALTSTYSGLPHCSGYATV